ncbi:MAG TPA: MraY family glycosyltransferase [Flavipsychrobacter sp.]|nr:MraY family glycosyltransferase [Flavipsychrobacter sp.]
MIVLPPYIVYLLAFICSLTVSLISIPKIIYISKRKRLFDIPDNNRKVHLNIIPNLGGVGIFFAYIIVTCLFITPLIFDKWNYIIASTILLFLTGINDDLITLSPSKKFLAQFVAAIITVCFADIRVNSLHGFLGIEQLPYWYSVSFSVIGCMFITNAFNLIDGIDGLAGSIGVLCTFSLGVCLAFVNNIGAACISFALMGAIVGFLRYNIAPAKIFMGDTGSLLIGFTISILSILFVHAYNVDTPLASVVHSHKGSLIVTLAILSIPVFDSFRVFSTRIARGGSPFKADRTHLHHYLLDLGYTHSGSVSILITSNILVITVALLVQDCDPNIALASIVALALGLFTILYSMRKKKLEKNRAILAARSKQITVAGTTLNTNAAGAAIIGNDKK